MNASSAAKPVSASSWNLVPIAAAGLARASQSTNTITSRVSGIQEAALYTTSRHRECFQTGVLNVSANVRSTDIERRQFSAKPGKFAVAVGVPRSNV
jgi:hypothetical protein